MKKNIFIALIAAAAIAPVAAQAQSYAGVNVGRSTQKADITGFGSFTDHTTAFKLYGGYQFNENFGIEGGYADLGKAEYTYSGVTQSGTPRSIYVAATGTMPLAERFALIGKIGAARTRTTITTTGFADDKQSKTTLLLGVGTTYAITPTILAVVEYEYFGKVIKEDTGSLKTNVLSAGVRFKF
jgi:OOP family OmpA-OmpF porin